ncbi:MAG: M20/M25/M40 family metallo-hydrolase [Alphaproteobacteria bacterium]
MVSDSADYVVQEVGRLGYKTVTQTRRGHVRVRVQGKAKGPVRAICSHLDTLGAMVAEIKSDGTLRLSRIGGFAPRSAENARVTIHSQTPLKGTLLIPTITAHSYGDVEMNTHKADWDTMVCRVDGDVVKAGVRVGDYVSIDTGYEESNGYIVSRFLDNKASAAIQLAVLQVWKKSKITPAVTMDFVFSVDEEVSYGGASMLAEDTADCVALDIAPVSKLTNSHEKYVTVALKDGLGPYSLDLSRDLIALGEKLKLPLKTDVFRFYRSDAGAAVFAGMDIRIALMGFGTDATHGYERTHTDALMATAALVEAWGRS